MATSLDEASIHIFRRRHLMQLLPDHGDLQITSPYNKGGKLNANPNRFQAGGLLT
jgi:hypothetical protein